MDDKAKEARRKYKRNWAKANPDKIKAQQARYWARVAEREASKTSPGATPQSAATFST